MSFEALRDNVVARMEANWSATDVAYENIAFTPPNDSPWVRLTIRPAQGQTRGIDGNQPQVLDTGLITMQLFVPTGDGTKAGLAHIDNLKAIYEHSRFNGILVYSATVTIVGDDSQGWHQTNITLPFRRIRNV